VTESGTVPAAYPRTPRAVLTSIALGAMLAPLNSTMIAVALPDIMREFRADVRAVGWLVTAYLVTMAVLQLVAGKLGDRVGRRRSVLAGLFYFGLASLLAALSPSLPVLVFARVQQAIAGAVLITNGIALTFQVVPEDHRGRDLGVVHAVVVLAAAIGPPLGGLLVNLAGWRAIFWASTPLAAAALLVGWSAIPNIQPEPSRRRFDPLEIPSLFRMRTFACANGAILFGNLAMYVVLLAVPIWMSTQSSSSLQTGLLLAAMSVTTAAFSPLGGRLSDRNGRRLPGVAGAALLTLGLLPLAVLNGVVANPLLLACLLLMGIGLGLSSVSLQTAVLESVQREQVGLATGIASTSRYVGSIAGSSILARILGSAPAEVGDFRVVFLVTVIAACIAIPMSLGIRSKTMESSGIKRPPGLPRQSGLRRRPDLL
jgi:MFS family permease